MQTVVCLLLLVAVVAVRGDSGTDGVEDNVGRMLREEEGKIKVLVASVKALRRQRGVIGNEITAARNDFARVADERAQAGVRKRDRLEAREQVSVLRRMSEERLAEVRRQIPLVDTTLQSVTFQLKHALEQLDALRIRKFAMLQQREKMFHEFRHTGLEHWVESSLRDSVSPFVSDALVQGTASVVEPFLDGIEHLADVNDVLAKLETFKETVPIAYRSPFYSGFVTYLVILLPMALVVSVLLRVKRAWSKLSLRHYLVLSNFYFAVMSAGCCIASLLGSVDVLQTFRRHNFRVFEFAMFLHGLGFMMHTMLHAVLAVLHKTRGACMQISLVLVVGMHFFFHSYRHTLRREVSHVDAGSYSLYTCCLLYVLYELSFDKMRLGFGPKHLAGKGHDTSPANAVNVGPIFPVRSSESISDTATSCFLAENSKCSGTRTGLQARASDSGNGKSSASPEVCSAWTVKFDPVRSAHPIVQPVRSLPSSRAGFSVNDVQAATNI